MLNRSQVVFTVKTAVDTYSAVWKKLSELVRVICPIAAERAAVGETVSAAPMPSQATKVRVSEVMPDFVHPCPYSSSWRNECV